MSTTLVSHRAQVDRAILLTSLTSVQSGYNWMMNDVEAYDVKCDQKSSGDRPHERCRAPRRRNRYSSGADGREKRFLLVDGVAGLPTAWRRTSTGGAAFYCR